MSGTRVSTRVRADHVVTPNGGIERSGTLVSVDVATTRVPMRRAQCWRSPRPVPHLNVPLSATAPTFSRRPTATASPARCDVR
jgi:hypothetical protein